MNEIIAELEKIAESLYAVRLPVAEAGAYSSVLDCANKIGRLVKKMKEDEVRAADNQQE